MKILKNDQDVWEMMHPLLCALRRRCEEGSPGASMQARIQSFMDAGDFVKVIERAGSKEVAEVIVELADRLSRRELRRVLRENWDRCDAHRPFREDFLELFRRAGYVSDTRRKPRGVLTIYRGNLSHGQPPAGLSWTLSVDVARWFAQYCATSGRANYLGMGLEGGDPTIWRAKINAEDILGYFIGRKEREVVVDPATIFDIEKLDTLTCHQ